MDRTINERINYVHERLRKNFDKLTRIAIAIYDQHTDKIKTFVHSTDGKPPLFTVLMVSHLCSQY